MAEQAFNPNPASTWVPPSVYYGDMNASGAGTPEGVVTAWPGATYVDTDTGDLYKKISGEGTAVGWTVQSGGSGGGVTHGAALDPNGSVTGVPGDIYRSSIGLGGDGSLWTKRTGAGTNVGWE